MKYYTLLFFTFTYHLCVYAQLTPVYNVSSPEAGTLGTFGTIPVSHYTGVPDISIPLYEVKVGNFTLPLTARYHLSSVKPHTPPTTLGLGWVLDAGGYISRTVRGVMDEKQTSDGYDAGFYYHHSNLQNINETKLNQLVKNIHDGGLKYEIAADEFSFSVCGYSGYFYMNEFGQWIVVSDHDVKVELDNTTPFIYRKDLNRQRIAANHWGYSDCNRFFNQFIITSPDGYRFFFGGQQATEYSIPYYSRNTHDLVPTTWRLNKIITPEGRNIFFSYDTDLLVCDIRYSPQEANGWSKAGNGKFAISNNSATTGYASFNGFLLFPVCLSKIETPNEVLDFTYSTDNQFAQKFFDWNSYVHTSCLYWKNEQTRYDVFFGEGSAADQFTALINLPSGDLQNTKDYHDAVANSMKSKYLHCISIKPKDDEVQDNPRYVYFGYSSEGRFKLETIAWRAIPPLSNSVGRIYPLPQKSDSEKVQEYHFSYNTPKMPENPAWTIVDAWGYNTGNKISNIGTVASFSDVPANLYYTKAETLNQITYPTGGCTQLTYELNDYSTKLTDTIGVLKSLSFSLSAGGLRVSEVVNRNANGSLVNRIKYTYIDNITSGKSSGILLNTPTHELNYVIGDTTTFLKLKSQGGFRANSTNFNTPDVGYSTVFEEMFDSLNTSQGYIRHSYSNFNTDIFGHSHLDESPICSAYISGGGLLRPFTSNAAERGKLLSKEYYAPNGQLIKQEKHQYLRSSNDYLNTVHQDLICYKFNNALGDNTGTHEFAWLTKTYTYSYLPIMKEITEYPTTSDSIVTRTFYSYNNHKMVIRDSTINSNGDMVVNSYQYLRDSWSNKNTWLKQGNFSSLPLSQTTRTNNQTKTVNYSYGKKTIGNGSSMPYVQTITTKMNNDQEIVAYQVDSTDEYGNPVYITEHGVPSTLTWGMQGQCLTKRIIGSHTNENLDLPTYDYEYYPSLRLKMSEEPGKKKQYYEYDFMGRLINVYNSRSAQLIPDNTANGFLLDRHYEYDLRQR